MTSSVVWQETGLLALFRSPFLIPSLFCHSLLLMLALRVATLTPLKPQEAPISVELLEVKDGPGAANNSIGPSVGRGGPRTMPKLGTPAPPAQRRGKLDSGSTESAIPAEKPADPTPPAKPASLPGPKILAADRAESVNVSETSPDSLVRLPTKEAPTRIPTTAAELDSNIGTLAASNKTTEPAGIKALKEGTQIPGALRGTGTGSGPFGVPGGSRTGSGIAGAGSGSGTGGGSATGLKGISSADYNAYLSQLKKRVESVWKYPEGVNGVQKVAILFTLDRAGRLVQSEVLESTDARLNASAVEAMKRAAPFAPIPETLKDLANTPLRMQFTVTIGVRG
ncbi:MAG TPA: energy transducer TonB [Candidatus Binatia bacterium]|nr:energy transducer TonB [Candidatus Binatia bacterium]